MEIENEGEGQLQILFTTKQKQYAIADTPYAINADVTTSDLNSLINSLLKESGANEKRIIEFDFLVSGEFLRIKLCHFLKDRSISSEDTIEIEYVERFPAPDPQDCLLHDDWVSAVRTRDKWILSGCYDNTINIWTMKGTHVLTIPGHSAPIKAVAWISLDAHFGVFASASMDQMAMIWQWDIDRNSVTCMYVCKGHERGLQSIGINQTGKLMATGSWDTLLKVWSAELEDDVDKMNELNDGKTRTPKMTLQGHREAVSSVKWMADDIILTSSWDHTIKIWDLSMSGIRSEITTNKCIFDMNYSSLNKLIITASADKTIRLYDPRILQTTTIVKNSYLGHTQWVQAVHWSPTDEYLFMSGAYDKQVKLWDMRSPKAPLYDLMGHEDNVLACDWSNEKYIVSGGADNTVRIFKSKKKN